MGVERRRKRRCQRCCTGCREYQALDDGPTYLPILAQGTFRGVGGGALPCNGSASCTDANDTPFPLGDIGCGTPIFPLSGGGDCRTIALEAALSAAGETLDDDGLACFIGGYSTEWRAVECPTSLLGLGLNGLHAVIVKCASGRRVIFADVRFFDRSPGSAWTLPMWGFAYFADGTDPVLCDGHSVELPLSLYTSTGCTTSLAGFTCSPPTSILLEFAREP